MATTGNVSAYEAESMLALRAAEADVTAGETAPSTFFSARIVARFVREDESSAPVAGEAAGAFSRGGA